MFVTSIMKERKKQKQFCYVMVRAGSLMCTGLSIAADIKEEETANMNVA